MIGKTTILTGDARELLKQIPDNSVQCCVTSPPYFNLRDYGTGVWKDGDMECDHKKETRHQIQGANSVRAGRSSIEAQRNETFSKVCATCGAVRTDNQIGLEASPQQYVTKLVMLFREIKRVLRDDGISWLNIGDSYARQGGTTDTTALTIKSKDLIGIPWMTAFALRDDGWYLRSDVIWQKSNPMPESTKDRPTSAHEHVFLLSKQERYFYDAAAIAEPMATESKARYAYGFGGPKNEALRETANRMRMVGEKSAANTRNARNVWTITTNPYKGAHFATMPVELATRCILAGSRPGDTVLDPFGGAGTTAVAANQNGRDAILIELNPDYVALAESRLKVIQFPDWAI